MDLFLILGVFPLTINLYNLIGFNFGNKNSDKLFLFSSIFFSLIWLFCGFFTEQWKLFLALMVCNNLILSRFDNIFFSKLKNIIVIFVVILVSLIRLKIIVWNI